MKAEKVILSFVAIIVGLLAAGVAFYLYQATQVPTTEPQKPQSPVINTVKQPTAAPNDNILEITEPKDEIVSRDKVIQIKGKTTPGAVVTISTDENDKVIKPADNGEFTLTQSISDGTNIIQISAIFPDGTEKKEARTVTYSTEDF